jgi:DNA-binding transcriptional LysR family regulator
MSGEGKAAPSGCDNAPVLEWGDLRYLLALHRTGSIARAAKSCQVDKATVSRRLAALESALGVPLLQRTASSVRLTEWGLRAVEAAHAMELAARGLEESLQGADAQGPVRLTLPGSIARSLIMPKLPDFQETCPGIELQLLSSDRILDLTAGEADVAVRNIRPTEPGLVCRKLGTIAYALYGSEDYLRRRGRPDSAAALEGHLLIVGQVEPVIAHGHRWMLDLGLHIAFRAWDMGAQVEAIRSGIGLGVAPCFVADEESELERIGACGWSVDEVWAAWPEDLRGVTRVQRVVAFIAGVWREAQGRLDPRLTESP